MDILNKLLGQIEDMLDKISVEKYENVKRMGAVMDAVRELRAVIKSGEKETEGNGDDNKDQQGEHV